MGLANGRMSDCEPLMSKQEETFRSGVFELD